MAGRQTQFDPLEGVSQKSTKEELMERLRKAAALIRRQDREDKARLQEIEERLRSQLAGVQQEQLRQVIVSATTDEWRQAVEFLEEFDDLLPASLQRLVTGGQVLLGHTEDGNG